MWSLFVGNYSCDTTIGLQSRWWTHFIKHESPKKLYARSGNLLGVLSRQTTFRRLMFIRKTKNFWWCKLLSLHLRDPAWNLIILIQSKSEPTCQNKNHNQDFARCWFLAPQIHQTLFCFHSINLLLWKNTFLSCLQLFWKFSGCDFYFDTLVRS